MKTSTYLLIATAGAVACFIGFRLHTADLSFLAQIGFSLLAGLAWPVVLVFGLLGAASDCDDDSGDAS